MYFETTHPTEGYDITVICDNEGRVEPVIDSVRADTQS